MASRYSVVPVVVGRRHHARIGGAGRVVAAHLAAGVDQHGDQRLQVASREPAVDEQRLGRAADAGAAHLGVQHDLFCHREVGGRVDVDVADAFQMREHRHARLALHARRPGSCRRAARSRRSCRRGRRADRPTAARSRVGTSWIASAGRAGLLCEARARARRGSRASERKLSEPPRRITALPALSAQRAGVGGDVGPALVDDGDDAERRAHALDAQAVGPVPGGGHLADRVGRACHRVDARRPWRRRASRRASGGRGRRGRPSCRRRCRGPRHWPGESPTRSTRIAAAAACSAFVLLLGRRVGERAGGGAGAFAHVAHQCGDARVLFRKLGPAHRFCLELARVHSMSRRSGRFDAAEHEIVAMDHLGAAAIAENGFDALGVLADDARRVVAVIGDEAARRSRRRPDRGSAPRRRARTRPRPSPRRRAAGSCRA